MIHTLKILAVAIKIEVVAMKTYGMKMKKFYQK